MRCRTVALCTIFAALLAGCGGGDSPPPPVVEISISPASIPAGQSASLMWSATAADSCVASGAWSGAQSLNGTLSVTPTSGGPNTYTLACTGPGGTSEQSAIVTVTPTLTISLNPSTIPAGQSVSLSWNALGVAACTASGAWSGAQATSGSTSVSQATPGTYTYTLGCTGPGGNVSQSATLTVISAITISVSPATIAVGQSATLSWNAYGVSTCNASGAWSGAQQTSGNVQVSPAGPGTYTYTLDCSAASGGLSQSATLTVTPGLSLSFTSGTIVLGQSTTLVWSSAGATACTASGAWSGTQTLSGSLAVTPAATGRYPYTLTCSGGGQSVTQTVILRVNPAVTLSVSPASVPAGQSAMLTWSSDGAATCTAYDAWTGTPALSGSAPTSPVLPGGYVYALSCSDATGDSTTVTADLTVTANGFALTSLVADISGTGARATDPSLVNPWAVVIASGSAAVVANGHTGTSTSYDGSGAAATSAPMEVHLPAGASGAAFAPTGVVVNPNNADFLITKAGSSQPATLIYAGESGMLAGWSASLDATNAITAYADTAAAVYKGLAVANNGTANYLYATDFHNNKIDVFDRTFTRQASSATSFSFTDPTLPAGYAPFGIQALNVGGATRIYVTYAQQLAPANHDNVAGAGLGLVDVFDANGRLLTHLIAAGGVLNAPWGMALPPRAFGPFAGQLLVSNSGDGRVNAFDPMTGTLAGTLSDSGGTPLAVAGMRGIAFGNRSANQPEWTLFFAAGTNNGADGEYGRIDFGAAPRLHAPPSVTVLETRQCLRGSPLPPPFGHCFEYRLFFTADVHTSVGIADVEFFVNGSRVGGSNAAPYAISRLSTVPNGVPPAVLVTDVDGNITFRP